MPESSARRIVIGANSQSEEESDIFNKVNEKISNSSNSGLIIALVLGSVSFWFLHKVVWLILSIPVSVVIFFTSWNFVIEIAIFDSDKNSFSKYIINQFVSSSISVVDYHIWGGNKFSLMSVYNNGGIIFSEYGNKFAPFLLHFSNLVSVKVEREVSYHTRGSESGSFTVGAGKGIFGGYSTGRTMNSTTEAKETAALKIRYQIEKNAAIETKIINFGQDRKRADDLCALLHSLS